MNRCDRSKLAIVLLLLALLIGTGTPALAQTKAAAAEASGSKTLGSKTAPITMEVFSDFQCPACRDLYQQTLRQVIDNYVLTAKVYLVHRDMPLPIHKYARDAARYANAAARVGKFEQVVELLYAHQHVWSADGNLEAVVVSALTPAEMKQVRQLVRSGKLDAAIDQDLALGRLNQVRSTPTVILTHRGQSYPLPPGITYSLLRRVLDQLLEQ